MTNETNFVGKVVDKHIFLIGIDDNGKPIQCPHAELFEQKGLSALRVSENSELKHPFRRLTKKEVVLFFKGMDTDGTLLEKPSEWLARIEAQHAERMATDKEYRELFNSVK